LPSIVGHTESTLCAEYINLEDVNMKNLLFIAASLTALAGCATTESDNTATTVYEEKETVTGSRLPHRKGDGVKTVNKEDLERAMSQAGTNNGPGAR
jgi:heat shock protein HslJ